MAWKLPADLLREIIARSDHRTLVLVRFAATCKLLRRDLLSPPFDPRVIQAAPCILAYLCPDAKRPLRLAHPTSPAASSFCLSRSLSRKAVGILCKYKPLASRRGLVVLRRRQNFQEPPKSSHPCFDTCVYDPMSGAQSFFSNLPEIGGDCDRKYVPLTAADGIDTNTNSFLLLAFDFHGWDTNMTVHTPSSRGTWESAIVTYTYELGRYPYFNSWMPKKRGNPAIVNGGVIHWLLKSGNQVISYDMRTGKTGLVELPFNNRMDRNQIHLATSPDGKLLKLFAIQGFMIYLWLQHVPGGNGWCWDTSIDMTEKLRSLDPYITSVPNQRIEFEGSGKRTGEVVFLVVKAQGYSNAPIVFDLESRKMHRQEPGMALLEIDLSSWLQSMKIFS